MLGAIQTQKSGRNILFIYCQHKYQCSQRMESSDSMKNDEELQVCGFKL